MSASLPSHPRDHQGLLRGLSGLGEPGGAGFSRILFPNPYGQWKVQKTLALSRPKAEISLNTQLREGLLRPLSCPETTRLNK